MRGSGYRKANKRFTTLLMLPTVCELTKLTQSRSSLALLMYGKISEGDCPSPWEEGKTAFCNQLTALAQTASHRLPVALTCGNPFPGDNTPSQVYKIMS